MKREKDLVELKSIIGQHKKEIEEKFNVKQIEIFGSYVRGEQDEKSDIDILVEFTKPMSLLKIVSLENYLLDLLNTRVDVVPKKNIRKELRNAILKEAVLV